MECDILLCKTNGSQDEGDCKDYRTRRASVSLPAVSAYRCSLQCLQPQRSQARARSELRAGSKPPRTCILAVWRAYVGRAYQWPRRLAFRLCVPGKAIVFLEPCKAFA